eukprot:Skav236163  [mRNA]  locus=scaffold298:62660:66717:+ [translate_table: standard]
MDPRRPPHKREGTTSGEECTYQWSLGNFTCNAYCCNLPDRPAKESACAVCFSDGDCFAKLCLPSKNQLKYVLGRMWHSVADVAVHVVLMLFFLFACVFIRSKPGERGMLVKAVCVAVLTTLVIFVFFGIYLFTDCRDQFRGVSDIFLALSFVVLFYFGIFLIYAVVFAASAPKLDWLLSIVAESRSRNDEDSLLLLEVGEDCLRRANDGSWRLRFLTSARCSQQTLLQRHDIEVEIPQVFPLEAHDVQRARDWLARHEVFHLDAEID